jgi:hypothetical protein
MNTLFRMLRNASWAVVGYRLATESSFADPIYWIAVVCAVVFDLSINEKQTV